MKKFLIILSLFIVMVLLSCCGKVEEPIEASSAAVVVPTPAPKVIEQEETETETKKETKKLKSNEEVVQDVIDGLYGNGQKRWKKLTKEGYDADLIQSMVDEYFASIEPETSVFEVYNESYTPNTGALNPYVGVVFFNGHKETYYSQRVLPGGGLDIPGRHVAEDGTIRDGDGYICVAADPSYLPYGSIVETSLGTGKVYDSGCDYGIIDIYTDW